MKSILFSLLMVLPSLSFGRMPPRPTQPLPPSSESSVDVGLLQDVQQTNSADGAIPSVKLITLNAESEFELSRALLVITDSVEPAEGTTPEPQIFAIPERFVELPSNFKIDVVTAQKLYLLSFEVQVQSGANSAGNPTFVNAQLSFELKINSRGQLVGVYPQAWVLK